MITTQTLHYANGEKYVGETLDSMRHGRGVFTSAAGEKYDGNWYLDRRNGRGDFTAADGASYRGEWQDDVPHG